MNRRKIQIPVICLSAILFLVTVVLSCQDSPSEMKVQEQTLIENYIESNNITVEPRSSGLYFIPGRTGIGPEIEKGDTVEMHFKEKLLKDEELIKSTFEDEPYTYIHGETEVIEGFKEGVGLMHEGESATLIVPSDLAYGKVRNGPIPPYSPLLFEIYILDVKEP